MTRLADDRIICSSCAATAVYDASEMEILFRETLDIIRTRLNLTTARVPALHIARADTIRSHGDAESARHSEKLLGLFVRKDPDIDIYVLGGLPRSLSRAVLAHEYAHAWQAEHCPASQALELKEGFAEWVSYKVLEHLGLEKEKNQIERRADAYGKGFRHMRRIEEQGGVAAVLKYVIHHP